MDGWKMTVSFGMASWQVRTARFRGGTRENLNNMMNILPSFLAFLVNHCEMHLGDESKLGIGHRYVLDDHDVFFPRRKLRNLQSGPGKCKTPEPKLMHLWWHDFYIYQTYNLYEADLFGYFVKNSSKIMVTFKLSLWAQLHLFGQVMETDHPQETSIFDIFFGVLQFTTTTIRFLFMVLSCITMTKNMCISKKQL